MPHCILEYSNNVVEVPDLLSLLSDLNTYLAETGFFKKSDIKSRAICHDTYLVGEKEDGRPFVSLDIRILSGRDDPTKATISGGALEILLNAFNRSVAQKKCSVTVQITDLHRESYARSGNRP